MIIEKPFISICGVSPLTGIKLNLNLNDVETGFFARFLIITPPHNKKIPPALPNKDVYHDLEVEQKLEDMLLPLINLDNDSIRYVLSMEAETAFERIHNTIHKSKEKYDEKCQEILEPFIKRWSPYVLKIAMIMQYVENPEAREIGVAAIESSWKFISIAVKSTGALYEGELGESEIQRKCRVVYEWIKKKHKETNAPILRKAILSSKKLNGGSKEYDYVLETLLDQGKLDVNDKVKKKNEWEYTPKD